MSPARLLPLCLGLIAAVVSALSGAFGGLIAWAILYIDGVKVLAGWRWYSHPLPPSVQTPFLTLPRLYIIEGIIIIVWVGICIYVVLKNYEAAYFLNEDDRVTMRRRAELAEAYSGGTGRYGMKDMKEAAKDTKSWLHEVIQICVVTILYGRL